MSAMNLTPQAAQFGLIGLVVMGENLALNIEDHGYRVALWTHTEAKVQRFVERNGASRRWIGTRTLEEFTAALAPPRRILLMVKAGEPVDEMLDRLAPLLSPGDVMIDGGNSFSSMKAERVTASTLLASATTGRVTGDAREMVTAVHNALRGAMVCAYAQGMSLLRTASGEYGWGVDLREIARIWKGGCIIRARLAGRLSSKSDS